MVEKRTYMLGVRLSPTEKEELVKRANKRKITFTALARIAILELIERE